MQFFVVRELIRKRNVYYGVIMFVKGRKRLTRFKIAVLTFFLLCEDLR